MKKIVETKEGKEFETPHSPVVGGSQPVKGDVISITEVKGHKEVLFWIEECDFKIGESHEIK